MKSNASTASLAEQAILAIPLNKLVFAPENVCDRFNVRLRLTREPCTCFASRTIRKN